MFFLLFCIRKDMNWIVGHLQCSLGWTNGVQYPCCRVICKRDKGLRQSSFNRYSYDEKDKICKEKWRIAPMCGREKKEVTLGRIRDGQWAERRFDNYPRKKINGIIPFSLVIYLCTSLNHNWTDYHFLKKVVKVDSFFWIDITDFLTQCDNTILYT